MYEMGIYLGNFLYKALLKFPEGECNTDFISIW